ncbi:MAG: hypothetical protein K2Q09_06380 [Phycisphaerales bacterium]|nr:hypothetical protein [Phycisphaerales bacterium]
MAEVVYILCALASLLCAGLLLRGYVRTRSRLLLWSSLCFGGLAVNNVLLVVDKVLTGPEVDLGVYRGGTAVAAVCVMLYGLVFDTE